MNCLLVAATSFEISQVLDSFRDRSLGTDKVESLDVLIAGIGLTATTYSLQKRIYERRPDLIIQAGIGGCFDPSLPLGKVVAISKDRIADEGVIENNSFRSIIDLGLVSPDLPPFKDGWLHNPHFDLLRKSGIEQVSAVSINQISSSDAMISYHINRFSPKVESMEGAALHYVALQENIPFLQIRSLSNYIGERDKTKWKLKDSIDQLNNELKRLLESL